MLISELNNKQSRNWQIIENQLASKGWQRPEGLLLSGDAHLDFENGKSILSLQLEDDSILLTIEKNLFEGISLRIYMGELEQLLNLIVEYQDELVEKYQDFVEELLGITKVTVLKDDEEVEINNEGINKNLE